MNAEYMRRSAIIRPKLNRVLGMVGEARSSLAIEMGVPVGSIHKWADSDTGIKNRDEFGRMNNLLDEKLKSLEPEPEPVPETLTEAQRIEIRSIMANAVAEIVKREVRRVLRTMINE